MKIKLFNLIPFTGTFIFVGLFIVTLSSCYNKAPKSNSGKKTPDRFAVFKFQEEQFDFGKINDGDTVSHQFSFINVGKVPLIINDISTACGCTVVQWPKNPITPDNKGNVIVQFSKHHDPGVHVKQIIIKANTKDPYTILHIVAFVKA